MHEIDHILYHTKHVSSERLKHVAKFSLKDSIALELAYIYLAKLINSGASLAR